MLPPSFDILDSVFRDYRNNLISVSAYHSHGRHPGFRKLTVVPLLSGRTKVAKETTQRLKMATQRLFKQKVDQVSKTLLQFTKIFRKVGNRRQRTPGNSGSNCHQPCTTEADQ